MEHTYARFVDDKYVMSSEPGSKFNLCFWSHFVPGNKLIALDRIKRILMVYDADNELNPPYIIELNRVTTISIKKTYGNIGPDELRTKGFEEFLKRIDLQLEHSDIDEPVVLAFYNSETDEP